MSARLIGRTGATAGQDFVLMDVATMGASPDNEIRITAPGVSRRHARVVKDKDQYFLEDAGATNGTFLNGGRVQREALQHLDVITLGRNVDLIFIRREGDTLVPKPDAITAARVQIVDGPEAGTIVDVPKGELTLGRAPSCNVVIASGLVSKIHARIQRTANQVVLQDLQSINGTFVNGTRVDSVVVLKNGDTISFAGVRSISVAIEGTAAAASASAAPAIVAEQPAFNQEWKTRFVWAPDELAAIEQARAEAMQLAALRAPAAAPADKKAPVAAKPAAPAKPDAPAPKPAAPSPPAVAKPAPPPAMPAAAAAKPPVKAEAPAAPAIDKPDVAVAAVAPKPAPPVAPKGAGAQPPPTPAGPVTQDAAAPKPAAPAKAEALVAADAKPGVAPAPVKADEVKPAPVPRTPIAPKPGDAVKPAGPAQAVVRPADAPIKPGSPIPVKPDPDSVPTMAIKASDIKSDATMPMGTKAPRLRGIRLRGPGAPIALGLGSFVVGRSAGSDVRLDDRQVSRSHARITVDETSATIEDLQTVNGTLLNGREVKARQPLNTGDTIQFGASEFTVELTTS